MAGASGNGDNHIEWDTNHDENALRQLAMLSQGPLKDSELYKLHMQHLSELTKTRLEMDKLEQQQTLLQMQKDLKRRQEEHEKDAEHELYMAEKQRQLSSQDTKNTGERDASGTDGPDRFSTSYDPESGLLIWFDFALGIPHAVNFSLYTALRLTRRYKLSQTLPVADCEPENNNSQKQFLEAREKFHRSQKQKAVLSWKFNPCLERLLVEVRRWKASDGLLLTLFLKTQTMKTRDLYSTLACTASTSAWFYQLDGTW